MLAFSLARTALVQLGTFVCVYVTLLRTPSTDCTAQSPPAVGVNKQEIHLGSTRYRVSAYLLDERTDIIGDEGCFLRLCLHKTIGVHGDGNERRNEGLAALCSYAAL